MRSICIILFLLALPLTVDAESGFSFEKGPAKLSPLPETTAPRPVTPPPPRPITPAPLPPAATITPPAAQVPHAAPVSYEMVYREVFAKRCVFCHKALKFRGGIRLDTYRTTLAVVKPGSLEGSRMWKQVSKGYMPPAGEDEVSPAEMELVKNWILQGAKGPEAPSTSGGAVVGEANR